MAQTTASPSGHWWRAEDVIIDVYARQLGPSATLVYLCLCRHANAERQCWPSATYIAEELALSKATVYSALKRLTKAGLIHRQRRTNYMGFKTSCLTTLLPIPNPASAPRIDEPSSQIDDPDDQSLVNRTPMVSQPLTNNESTVDQSLVIGSLTISHKVASIEVASIEVASIEVASIEVASSEVASSEVASIEVASIEVASIEVASSELASIQEPPPQVGARVGGLPSRSSQFEPLRFPTPQALTNALAMAAVLDRAGRAAEVDALVERAQRLGLAANWLTHRLTKLADPAPDPAPSPTISYAYLAQLDDALGSLKPRRRSPEWQSYNGP